MSKTLTDFRKEIDSLDIELIQLLARRMDIVREVALYKEKNNLPAVIPERVEEVRNNAVNLAKKYNLPENYIYNLWTQIITESCDLEQRHFDSSKAPNN